jgi:hypothetical protein
MLKVANSVINASRITGVLPVANGGTGVTTSTGTGNTVLSASPTLSGDVNLSTGNLVIGTAGKGIDFSVTSSGSGTMTSELLADYEEGTFTPTLAFNGASVGISYDYAFGFYVKTGRQVHVDILLVLTNKGSSTGDATLGGLPFATNSATFYRAAATVGYISGITFSGIINAGSSNGATVVALNQSTLLGTASSITDTNFANNSAIAWSFTYQV